MKRIIIALTALTLSSALMAQMDNGKKYCPR